MKLGIAYDFLSQDIDKPIDGENLLRHARLADELGFHSFWAGETHQRALNHGHTPSPLMGLAAVALATRRMRLGTSVLLLPLYHPLRLAEDAAVLDCLSKGRLTLGMALGGEANRKCYNVPPEHSLGIFRESLKIVRKLWTEPNASFAGRYFQVRDVTVTPKPVQKPAPPILTGGGTPASARRAAALADGWVGASNHGFDFLKEMISTYRNALDGKKGQVVVNRVLYTGEGGDGSVVEEARPYFTEFVSWYKARGALKVSTNALSKELSSALPELVSELGIIGSPESCVDQIRRYEEIGVDQLNLRLRLPGFSPERTEKMMRVVATRILPHFS